MLLWRRWKEKRVDIIARNKAKREAKKVRRVQSIQGAYETAEFSVAYVIILDTKTHNCQITVKDSRANKLVGKQTTRLSDAVIKKIEAETNKCAVASEDFLGKLKEAKSLLQIANMLR